MQFIIRRGVQPISEPAKVTASAADLLPLAIAGDTLALERLLLPYQSRLLARLRRRIPASLARVLAAEDLLQDSFCDVVRKIGDFRPAGPHSFERWLITIADNRLIDAIRNWSAAKRGGGWTQATGDAQQSHAASLYELLRVDSHTPSRVAAATEMEAAVIAAIGQLKPEYREAVRLRFIENLDIQEVAERLGRSTWSAHKLCARGLLELERILAADWRSSA